ncbi:alpha/beta fold hydrolase [Planctomycetota bacterium]|nr:alpha/beta fold hydrolase [Planctomycetota bacterium]
MLSDMSSAHVHQITNAGARVLVAKQVLRAPLPDGGALALVRKRPVGGAPRGAVVLLHGLGQNRYSWHLDQRSLSAFLVDRGYDVFNLEMRGHGRSRGFGSASPQGFEDYAERDLPAALDAIRKVGHERVFLLGHSLGGAVAYAAAGATPERFRGVVTVSGVFAWGGGTRALSAFARLLHRAQRTHGRLGLRGGMPLRLDLVGRSMAAGLTMMENAWFLLPAEAWTPGSIERPILHQWLTRAFDRTSGSVLAQMARWARTGSFNDNGEQRDYAQAWSRCGVPTLILAGDRDKLAHPWSDVKPAFDASSARDRTYRCFGWASDGEQYGHVDLLVGRRAPHVVWPLIAEWLDAH